MNEPLYPIGIQTFSEIRERGFVYVDKTEYIYRLITRSKYVFLSRPRRFGKSLTLSTIEAIFEGRRDLFDGLAIAGLMNEWNTHPVLHLDFTGNDYNTYEGFSERLDTAFRRWEEKYEVKSGNYRTWGARLDEIIRAAFNLTGKQVVILIDEYDKPLLETVDNSQLQERYRNELRGIYGNLKGDDRFIRFAMLTGVARFGHLSIFSDLNNLKDISLTSENAGICGVTVDELKKYFGEGVNLLAEREGITEGEAYEALKRNYDGYHFSPREFLDVYNPFSLLNAIENKWIDDYWFRSGTPTFLVKMIRAGNMKLQRLSEWHTDVQSLSDVSLDLSNYESLLYQSGYLTIKGYDRSSGMLTLGYPNMEVERGFLKNLMSIYTPVPLSETAFTIREFVMDINEGRADSFMRRLQSFFSDFQYDSFDLKNLEQHYQDVIYIVAKLMGFITHVEYRTATGRIDLLVKTDKFIYIFEFKIDKSACDAIDQIERKDYLLPFKADGRTIVKIGASFSTELRTIADGWIIKKVYS